MLSWCRTGNAGHWPHRLARRSSMPKARLCPRSRHAEPGRAAADDCTRAVHKTVAAGLIVKIKLSVPHSLCRATRVHESGHETLQQIDSVGLPDKPNLRRIFSICDVVAKTREKPYRHLDRRC